MSDAIKVLLTNAGMALLSVFPIERIVAMYLNKMLDKVSPANIDKARTTAKHLGELSELLTDILEDKEVSASELSRAKDFILSVRESILATWAKGKSAKQVQRALGDSGLTGSYVEDAEVIQ